MTLLELVVAIAVFSLVAAASYAGLNQGLIIQDKLREQRRFWQHFETVFNLAHSDFEQVVDLAPGNGIQKGLAFTGQDGATGDGHLIEFTRSVHTTFREGPASPFQRVAYSLSDGGLYRKTWSRLDLPYGTEAAEALLLDGIEDIRFRYLASTNKWTTRWPPPLNPENPAALPKVVEITVELDVHGSFRWLFHARSPE